MFWMAVLMLLPLLGLVLFAIYPWRLALVPYLIVVAISMFFHGLMMRSMRLPLRSGSEQMVGSTAVILTWQGRSGQVMWNDQIWQAEAAVPLTLERGETVVIEGVSGLTLSVKLPTARQN